MHSPDNLDDDGSLPDNNAAKLYCSSKDFLSSDKVFLMLTNPDISKISTLPPMQPKRGDVYVYSFNGDVSKEKDWSCDGYKWVNKSGRKMFTKNKELLWKQTYYLSEAKGDAQGSKLFQRHMFRLKDGDTTFRVIHYYGDHSIYTPQPHGNSKSGTGDYRRTLPSVLNIIKEKGTDKQPSSIYKEMVTTNGVTGSYQGVSNPRNINQVRMQQKQVRTRRQISQDQIYNSLQLAYHLERFVQKISIFPDLVIVLGLQDLLQELNKVLLVKSDEPVVISYDTTFNLGDFYLSIVVAKHIIYQGGRTFPVAFIIHDRKCQAVHEELWKVMRANVPNLSKQNHIFVTDREQAFQNVLTNIFPKSSLFLCWNHIRRDLVFWLRKQGAKTDDITVYTRDLLELLHSETSEEYDNKYSAMTLRWSSAAVDYFDKISPILKEKACRWNWEEKDVYDPFSGITNNISESINTVIKRLNEWKEAPVDAMVLGLYYLQSFYKTEMLRGRCGIGKFKLKQIHNSCALNRNDVSFPDTFCQPEEIVKMVKGEMSQETVHTNHTRVQNCEDQDQSDKLCPQYAESSTQKSLALEAIRNGRVHLLPGAQTFVVVGSKGDKYAVTLHPQEKCQCPSLGSCYHILAAKISLGIEDLQEKKIYNLTQLRKNNRKKPNKKAGKKVPRPCDMEDLEVIAAPDSVQKTGMLTPQRRNDTTMPIIPEEEESEISQSPVFGLKRKAIQTNKKSVKRLKFEDVSTTPCSNSSENSSESPEWVSNGSFSLKICHKDIIQNGEKLDCDIINFCQKLLRDQHPDIAGFQDTRYAPVRDNGKWKYALPFKTLTQEKAAQVHHTGQDHWGTTTLPCMTVAQEKSQAKACLHNKELRVLYLACNSTTDIQILDDHYR